MRPGAGDGNPPGPRRRQHHLHPNRLQGRCLMNDTQLVKHADNAYQAIRALNHQTYRSIPAPLAYSMLGNLRSLGVALSQLADQIDAGLRSSLITYDLYDDNRDP